MIIHLKNFKIPYYPPLTSSISIYSIFGRDIITFVLWEPSPSDWYHGWPLDYPDRISLSHSGPPQSAHKVRLIQYHWFEYHPVIFTVSLGVVHKLHLQNLDNFDHVCMSFFKRSLWLTPMETFAAQWLVLGNFIQKLFDYGFCSK